MSFLGAYWSNLQLFSAQHCMGGQPFCSHRVKSTFLDDLGCLLIGQRLSLVSYITLAAFC